MSGIRKWRGIKDDAILSVFPDEEDLQLARYRGLVISLVKPHKQADIDDHVNRVTEFIQSEQPTNSEFFHEISKVVFGHGLLSRHMRVELQLADYVGDVQKMLASFQKHMQRSRPQVHLDILELGPAYSLLYLHTDMKREQKEEWGT